MQPSKSLQYSRDLKSIIHPTRLLLLCEVALGRTKQFSSSDRRAEAYVNKFPHLRLFDSCSSDGTYAENFDGFVDDNGAIWPTVSACSFSHAESTQYIIYDNTQAKMRYLVRVEETCEPLMRNSFLSARWN